MVRQWWAYTKRMPSRHTDLALAIELAQRLDSLTRITDVVRVMELIQRRLTREDGIWWFTELYRRVTVAVDLACKDRFFLHPDWMKMLVIEFAKLYFVALHAWLSGDRNSCPPAWRVLFAKRFYVRRRGYSPLQFALAGVNAHIQRDLGRAATKTNARFPHLLESALWKDYERVNDILDEVEVEAMRLMATGWIRRLADLMHPWDRRAAMWMIRRARLLAWYSGKAIARTEKTRPHASKALSAIVEGYAWLCGVIVLFPYASHEKIPLVRGSRRG